MTSSDEAPHPSTWHRTSDLNVFLSRTETFLHSQPALHTLMLTLTDTVRTCGPNAYGRPPAMGWLEEEGQVRATYFRAAPHRLSLTPLAPEEADALAAHLADSHQQLPGVYADHDTATAFAHAWQRHTGATPTLHERQLLYRLDRLTPPQPLPAGHARRAAERDREDVARWYDDFSKAIGEPPSQDPCQWADTRIAYGGILFWENPDGTPVCIVGVNPMVAGQIRLAIAYTPSHLRGRGYAAAAMAEATRIALTARPQQVLLFTNLANPSSNAAVQRIGYRTVAPFALYDFAT